LALVYLGLRHPVTAALGEAIGDPSMVDRALIELGAGPGSATAPAALRLCRIDR
jgi:hypothetical protein